MPIHGYAGGKLSATPPTPSNTAAPGIWTLEKQAYYNAQGSWPPNVTAPISRSVRLRSSASAYFNRTPSGAGNQQKWTWSGWVKRGQTTDTGVFGVGTSGSNYFNIRFQPDYLSVVSETPSLTIELRTSALYRDYSAWYHIVFALDTTQATASDRAKLYVNGVQVTSFSTANYPSLNANLLPNSAVAHYLGVNGQATGYADGYFTEIYFVNAQQLAPTSFGAFDSVTGVWNPIVYTGTYGTNGFYLTFSDNSAATAAAIGKDSSGNGNNWTPNNISVTAGTTYDSMVDSPTNYGGDTGVGGEVRGNYCTLNPLNKQSNLTLSSANLDTSSPVTGIWRSVVGTVAMTSGKWYWEATAGATGAGNHYMVGIASTSFNALTDNVYVGIATDTWSYYGNNGTKYNNGAAAAYGASYTTNDVISITYDADNGTLAFYKNGVSQGTAFTGLSGAMVAGTSAYNGSGMYHNFGQRQFVYTAPSGYKALCTTNLPTATVSNGANYMAATLYTGNGSTQSITNTVNSISFQPDFVWTKPRVAASSHALFDSVRGASKILISNSTGAESNLSPYGLTAFNANGFSLSDDSAGNYYVNGASGGTYSGTPPNYVGWQWKGGGTAVTNTAGSITSSVSANPTAGFSVLTYTGTIANATVGHGLGIAPQMIIARNRTNVVNWIVYHVRLTSASYYLTLDETNGQTSNSIFWQGVAPTSTVFSLGANSSCNGSTSNIAYCFAPIAGYSAFISYTGNGSGDGPFVYCGFRPRYLMIKRYDASGDPWWVIDSTRSPYNQTTLALRPNSSNAEDSGGNANFDFLANGFKARTSGGGNGNESGATYIVAAFAENPFNISRAR